MTENTSNPYDINGQHFNNDMYLQKILKVQSLTYLFSYMYKFCIKYYYLLNYSSRNALSSK